MDTAFLRWPEFRWWRIEAVKALSLLGSRLGLWVLLFL